MPVSMSPVVEEFYNHVHGKGGRFASGRAVSGRAGFREGSHVGPGTSKTWAARGAVGKVMAKYSTRNQFPTYTTFKNSPGPNMAKAKIVQHRPYGIGKPVNKHKKTEVSPGAVYTSLKGSHTIRQTKSGKMVLHTRNAAPQVVSKGAAKHVKMLDSHKTTMAEAVLGKIARWNAKG